MRRIPALVEEAADRQTAEAATWAADHRTAEAVTWAAVRKEAE
jgi:hypothetical protein